MAHVTTGSDIQPDLGEELATTQLDEPSQPVDARDTDNGTDEPTAAEAEALEPLHDSDVDKDDANARPEAAEEDAAGGS